MRIDCGAALGEKYIFNLLTKKIMYYSVIRKFKPYNPNNQINHLLRGKRNKWIFQELCDMQVCCLSLVLFDYYWVSDNETKLWRYYHKNIFKKAGLSEKIKDSYHKISRMAKMKGLVIWNSVCLNLTPYKYNERKAWSDYKVERAKKNRCQRQE